jgi:acyl carrier protein
LSLDHSLAPIGSIGELHIAGDGLAKGYCNNEQLTNEKFSYNNVVKKRLYASGDLVRYLPDGNIEFIGRNDEQVKIRGFRVELTEIEECLIGINGIESALVQVIGSDSTDKYLVAYLILTSESMAFDNESLVTLKQQLGMLLPAYMIPSHYASLTRWPLTINGKIDKKLLLQHQTVTTTAVYVEPSNTTEKAIAVMWSKLLKLDQQTISVEANFFELGGHSLLATRMITELREAFALEVEMKIIFETKTLKELAVKVAAQVAFAEITKAKSHAKINKQGFL